MKKRIFKYMFFFMIFSCIGIILSSCSNSFDKEDDLNIGLSNVTLDSVENDAKPDPIYYEGDPIYYSDDYFRHRATTYNPHLATLSILAAKYSMNPGGPDSASDLDWYHNQSNRVHEFYNKIGFDDFSINEDYRSRPTIDTIGIAAAKRPVDDYTIISCVVRSGGYFLEWQNNVVLGTGENSDYMHEGWYTCANKVIKFVRDYIKEYNITGKIKLWLSGFSRGGAIMNLTGGLLDNQIDTKGANNVFEGVTLKNLDLLVYTFEAPQGANYDSKTVKQPRDAIYNNIFNIVNPNDVVTKVAMGYFGFTRFGIDKFITTNFYDPDNFENNRNTAKKLMAVKDPNYVLDADDFTFYNLTMKDVIGNLFDVSYLCDAFNAYLNGKGSFPNRFFADTYKVNYDSNIVFTTVLDWACWKIGSRSNYANKIQPLAVELMGLIFDDIDNNYNEKFSNFVSKLIFQGIAYLLFGDTSRIFDFWNEISGGSKENVAVILNVLVELIKEYPGEVISIVANMNQIYHNHDTQLNVIHAQAQDSYYIDNYNASSSDNITIVPYRQNAGLVRIECIDLNDGLINNDSKYDHWRTVVRVEGHSQRLSEITTCYTGNAVGYYHYSSYERVEYYVPACYDYFYKGISYSWDLCHQVLGVVWTYGTNATQYRTRKQLVNESFFCDSDYVETHIKAIESPN